MTRALVVVAVTTVVVVIIVRIVPVPVIVAGCCRLSETLGSSVGVELLEL